VLKTTLDPQIECASFSGRMESRQDPSWPLFSISEVSRSLRATLKFGAQESRSSPSKTMLRLMSAKRFRPGGFDPLDATARRHALLRKCAGIEKLGNGSDKLSRRKQLSQKKAVWNALRSPCVCTLAG
jgi:hypothetical protein